MTDDRRRRLLGDGEDPDPRFTLANERTLLAWIRTALAIIAAGIAVEAFGDTVLPAPWDRIVAVGLLLVGTAIAITSPIRWYRVESALRNHRPLPLPAIAALLSAAITIVALIAVILMFAP